MSFQDEHLGVFICQQVFEGKPVLYVSHDADNDWQFLCGSDDHANGKEKALIAGVNHLIEKDPTLTELESLPIGGSAERKAIGEAWNKTSLS